MDDLVTRKELASKFKCSVHTIDRRIAEMRNYPKYYSRAIVKNGRLIMVRQSAFEHYLNNRDILQNRWKIKVEPYR